MLPEQILGQALLYLVAAVGRQVVFRDPSRFGAALYDEAWALLASPHGQRLLLEGVRDGRKHNGAIWLASQHPNDLGSGELVDLVGSRFVFRQSGGAVSPALRFLGVSGSEEAQHVLAQGLGTGQCLYRDVRDRVGLIQVLEPVLDELRLAFDTTPQSDPVAYGAARAAARALRTGRSLPSLSEAEALEEAPPSLPAGEPPFAERRPGARRARGHRRPAAGPRAGASVRLSCGCGRHGAGSARSSQRRRRRGSRRCRRSRPSRRLRRSPARCRRRSSPRSRPRRRRGPPSGPLPCGAGRLRPRPPSRPRPRSPSPSPRPRSTTRPAASTVTTSL